MQYWVTGNGRISLKALYNIGQRRRHGTSFYLPPLKLKTRVTPTKVKETVADHWRREFYSSNAGHTLAALHNTLSQFSSNFYQDLFVLLPLLRVCISLWLRSADGNFGQRRLATLSRLRAHPPIPRHSTETCYFLPRFFSPHECYIKSSGSFPFFFLSSLALENPCPFLSGLHFLIPIFFISFWSPSPFLHHFNTSTATSVLLLFMATTVSGILHYFSFSIAHYHLQDLVFSFPTFSIVLRQSLRDFSSRQISLFSFLLILHDQNTSVTSCQSSFVLFSAVTNLLNKSVNSWLTVRKLPEFLLGCACYIPQEQSSPGK